MSEWRFYALVASKAENILSYNVFSDDYFMDKEETYHWDKMLYSFR